MERIKVAKLAFCLMDNGNYFPGLKRPKRKLDQPPPSNAEVKNAWNCNSVLPIGLHGVVLN